MAKHILPTVAALALAVTLSACAGKAEYHPADQSGPQPPLPKPANFLMPPMQVPKGVGWADGQAPTVAQGLKIERIAANLQHPRRLRRPCPTATYWWWKAMAPAKSRSPRPSSGLPAR